MQGAITKSYYAEKHGIDPKDIFVVSIMPCTAKKYEKERAGQNAVNGLKDVDAVLTTRELAKMIKTAGIQFTELEDEEFDPVMAIGSGAGTIFALSKISASRSSLGSGRFTTPTFGSIVANG